MLADEHFEKLIFIAVYFEGKCRAFHPNCKGNSNSCRIWQIFPRHGNNAIHWNTPNKANERKGPTHSKHERRFSTQKSYNISMYLFETVSFAIGDIFRGLFANLFSCSCHCCCCRWYSVRLLVLWWVFCVHFFFAMWFLCSLSSHVRLFAAKYFSQIFSKRTFFSVWPLRTVAIEKNQCNEVRRIR